MRIKDVLTELERVEHAVGDLYAWLAERFADDVDTVRFFRKLERDERSHANLVGFEQRLVRGNAEHFDAVEVDLGPVRELVARVETFPRDNPDPELRDALVFAMQIEDHCAEHLHRQVIVSSNPQLEQLVGSLAAADREHFQTLRRFVTARSELFR